MTTASVFDAKTNLSKYIASLLNKKEPYVIIVKNGKPVAKLVPYEEETQYRIGAGKETLREMPDLAVFNSVSTEEDLSGNGGLIG